MKKQAVGYTIIIVVVTLGGYFLWKAPLGQGMLSGQVSRGVAVLETTQSAKNLSSPGTVLMKSDIAKEANDSASSMSFIRNSIAEVVPIKNSRVLDLKNFVNEAFTQKRNAEVKILQEGATAEGFLSVYHQDDFNHKKSIDAATLFTEKSGAIDLDYEKVKSLLPKTGSYIRIANIHKEGDLGDKYSFKSLTTLEDAALESKNRVASGPTGKVSIILLNYTDSPTQPIHPVDAANLVFQPITPQLLISVKQWFYNVSYGLLNITGKKTATASGDVYGWYTSPLVNNDCTNTSDGIRQAIDYARTDGLVTEKNDFIVLIQPLNTTCSYGGYAVSIPIDPGNQNSDTVRVALINGTYVGTIIHEMGHLSSADDKSFVYHARLYACKDRTTGASVDFTTPNSSCEQLEYGDTNSVMGSGNINYFDNQERKQAGFLNINNYLSATNSGNYVLSPINTQSAKIVTIPLKTHSPQGVPLTDVSQELYNIETRVFDQPTKENIFPIHNLRDSFSTPNVQNTVFIRKESVLIDILNPGEIFTDHINNITITNLGSVGSGSANTKIHVQLPPQSIVCYRGNPIFSITPKVSVKDISENITLTVSVKNTDSLQGCGVTGIAVTNSAQSLFPAFPVNYYTSEVSYANNEIHKALYNMSYGATNNSFYAPGEVRTTTFSFPVTQGLQKSLIKFTPNVTVVRSSNQGYYGVSYQQNPFYVGFGKFTPQELTQLGAYQIISTTNSSTTTQNTSNMNQGN